ncbi:hypothetical protein K469DRAFT_726934 [Zopfia rhizophila CBS 207.26]|uniref:Uncharacterized protein n=1 Tax=Zopfia rhizophila CBS 207.26 TaxID=1314779 RepID=A0A6A6E2W4_9PEZI|nr:hypothetical protein K469DRAFT_726934 [Zopfia rhizophila CBS 207.26]
MSQFYHQNYSYNNQPEVLFAANLQYAQYNDPRSKTPTSLINHTGHSPGPLSTPQSRNNSQPPEPMNWDDVPDSLSTSPTSVRTPDNDSFEVEMLDASNDMRNFYENENIATHVTQGEAGMDYQAFFTDQALQNAMAAVMQQQQYNDQFNGQFQQPTSHNSMVQMAPQHFNRSFGQAYTRQPHEHDPWTGQGPPRNPIVPQSGTAVFDPESDNQVDYSQFLTTDWAAKNTDPGYLINPNTPAGAPMDSLWNNQISPVTPVEMKLTVSSPSPDSQNFVNYDQSSFFSESYPQVPQSYPSPGVTSTATQPALSPYEDPVSPLPSALSPGSDTAFSSYQHSDYGMVMDSYPNEQFDAKPQPPPSPIQVNDPSPTMTIPDVTYDPEPEPPRSQPTAKPVSGRPGGRALGTHLEPKVAKAAHDMRKIVACWHCVLQRDKCGPGDTCERCLKRSQRPNSDCGLGCSRVKLVELTQYFLPSIVTSMHEDAQLTHFVTQHIRQWNNIEITIYMTCGQAGMPRIPVKVYEFLPKTNELLVQLQYKTDPVTHQRIRVAKQSPALGMVHINHNEEKKYDKYINDIVDNHLDAFGELCWMEDDNDFQEKLFRLMTRVKPKSDDEGKLLREVFRLIICTFIMSHTLTIAEETKAATLSKLHSYTDPSNYVQNNTSPRMTNRQLKHFFARLQRSILTTVLNKLQQIFKSSKGCDRWISAFIAVIGMAMAHEDQQKTIHLVMETNAASKNSEREMRDGQCRADFACREIDERMGFIQHIFRWKYNRKCNPLRDAEHDWDREAGFGDSSSVGFVRQVASLVRENIDFLSVRQNVSISTANQTKYTSRLVGQFLLSFWLPS